MREIGASAACSGGGGWGSVARGEALGERHARRAIARGDPARSGARTSAGGGSTRARFASRRSDRATSQSAADGERARRPRAAMAGTETHLRTTGRNAAAEECVAKL